MIFKVAEALKLKRALLLTRNMHYCIAIELTVKPEMELGRVSSAQTQPEPEKVSPNPTRNRGLTRKPDSAQQ